MEPIQPQERPDWIPPVWTRGRFNRWFGRSPGRVFVWLIAWPLLAAALIVTLALSGDPLFWVFTAAVATVVGAAQSVIYAPRAWRAYRRQDRPSK